ncbi:hypothetical protein H4R21_002047, partial [Coemansia helicoidea]
MKVLVYAFLVLAEVAAAYPLQPAQSVHNAGLIGDLVDALLGPNALSVDLCLNLKLGDGPQSIAPGCPNYVAPPMVPPPGAVYRRGQGDVDNHLVGPGVPPLAPFPAAPPRRNKGIVGGLLDLLLGPNALNVDLCLDLNLGDGPQSFAPNCPNFIAPSMLVPPPGAYPVPYMAPGPYGRYPAFMPPAPYPLYRRDSSTDRTNHHANHDVPSPWMVFESGAGSLEKRQMPAPLAGEPYIGAQPLPVPLPPPVVLPSVEGDCEQPLPMPVPMPE